MARKKNWKRIDVSAVHESLVESNIARTIARTGIAEDIVIDTEGVAPSRRLAKKIKAQRHPNPIAARGAVERTKLQKLVARIKRKSDQLDIDEARETSGVSCTVGCVGFKLVQRPNEDIWGDDGERAVKRRPKMPNLVKVIPAVAAPHAGQSYNPDPEAHAELISQAIEALPTEPEVSEEPLTDLVQRALPELDVSELTFVQKQKLASLITHEKLDEEAIDKVLHDLHGEADDDESEEEDMGADEASRARRLKRKTRAQRNRQKVHKEMVKQALMRKQVKRLVHDIQEMKVEPADAGGDQSSQEKKEERLRRYLERLVRGKTAPKFGNKVYKADPPTVALSEEMKASLRQLQTPAKSPVDHVLDSIYRRGLVPAPPVIDDGYRDKARKRVLKRTRKFSGKLLKGT
ncbi:Nop53 (60S ribosomal biogenesis) protein [Babesia caballi]|uniref:Ribosome biogenesis protein NOP53 n=1 Tax=Babesia caballi TaxID=5871 RepID=A0AAV4LL19_BABCB|nr:Nop53 (60S ribosomal biogenesis) protein [Babesia caballi]